MSIVRGAVVIKCDGCGARLATPSFTAVNAREYAAQRAGWTAVPPSRRADGQRLIGDYCLCCYSDVLDGAAGGPRNGQEQATGGGAADPLDSAGSCTDPTGTADSGANLPTHGDAATVPDSHSPVETVPTDHDKVDDPPGQTVAPASDPGASS